MNSRVTFNLYLVTDRHQSRGRSLDDGIRSALEGGIRAVQLRERDLPLADLFRRAERLRTLTSEFGAKLLINERVDVCLAVGADGVHLRSDGLSVSSVRALIGPEPLIGCSTHSVSEALEARRDGADFIVLGPVYDTPSKRDMGRPIGISAVKSVVKLMDIPVFPIGGITAERIGEVMAAGARGAAVVSAVLGARDVRSAAQQLVLAVQLYSTRSGAIGVSEARK